MIQQLSFHLEQIVLYQGSLSVLTHKHDHLGDLMQG